MSDIVIQSGRSAVELAFFVILPVMIVMLTIMRLAEAKGILDWMVRRLEPVLRPFGLPGTGLLALFQNVLVSAFAPLATLSVMDRSDIPRRQLAATLALVMGSAQANAVFPLAALGMAGLETVLISIVSGLIGAALTYHLFARHLPKRDPIAEPEIQHATADDAKGILAVISRAGGEAFRITVSALPMLVLSLTAVNGLRALGVMGMVEEALSPAFDAVGLPSLTALLAITKYLAGGSAMMAVAADAVNSGQLTLMDLDRVAGLLIHPLDVAGVAILMSAGPRVGQVIRPAILGALAAVVLRTVMHLLLF
ncbi:MAG: nucleoside recognition domain-containing protein [Rhodospirillales bacterium]